MIIVLDSNEYLFFLNGENIHFEKLFQRVGFIIYIHRIIIEEVLRNIEKDYEKKFYFLLRNGEIKIDEDTLPLNLFKKYEKLGLKKGDITIASFCEKVGTDYLITENRHFLKSKTQDFQILNLEEFLKKFKLI